jgi:hypothetical protein
MEVKRARARECQQLPVPTLSGFEMPSGLTKRKFGSLLYSFLFFSPSPSPLSLLHLLLAMQSDEVIWQVINQQFCSYKVK